MLNKNKLSLLSKGNKENKQGMAFPTRKEMQENPWQSARRLHDDRIGDAYVRAYNWRLIALIASLTALIALLGIVILSSQKKFVPYVVEVDKLGNAQAVQFISQAAPVDTRVIRAYLSRFITDIRLVTSDLTQQKSAIARVYSMLAEGTPALEAVSEYYKSDTPADRAKRETVTATINSILQISDKTWQVEWTEVSRNLQGAIAGTSRWKASLTIATNPPASEQDIYINPLGMFITNLNWAKQI